MMPNPNHKGWAFVVVPDADKGSLIAHVKVEEDRITHAYCDIYQPWREHYPVTRLHWTAGLGAWEQVVGR